jgi:hypothetical protein
MDEREAACSGGFPSRDSLGTSFRMAGTDFGLNDAWLVVLLLAVSKNFFFSWKHPL